MFIQRLALCALWLCLLAAPVADARAAPALAPTYAAGWNMVSAWDQADLAGADAVYFWDGSSYQSSVPQGLSPCAGAWAYFSQPVSVDGTTMPPPTARDCQLASGWTMVGNPTSAPAALPAGMNGYWWDPATSQYQVVTSIPAGGSAWLYSDTARDISVSPDPHFLVITPKMGANSYTVHVGDTLEVQVLLFGPGEYVASTSGGHLALTGQSARSAEPVYYTWDWLATGPGTDMISIDKRFPSASAFQITVTIVP